jgi:4-amino-4-deoxy-L-arabinose transferase-like glycosyltransferase
MPTASRDVQAAPAPGPVLALLAGLTLASRLPLTGAVLFHWDSINYALALQQFDVTRSQPHCPGYIVYVALGRALDGVLEDPQRTLVTLSVLGSALSVALLYLLGRALFGPPAGLVAAVLLASSPLFWFYGLVALPHALDCGLVLAVVLLAVRVDRGDARFLVPLVAALAVAGGHRPQTQAFLLPLAVVATRRLALPPRMAAAAGLLVLDALWLVPLVASAGGPGSYLAACGSFAEQHLGGTVGGVANFLRLALYSAFGLAAAAVPLVLAPRQALAPLRDRDRGPLLLAWTLPCLGFYALVHMGQAGLVFVFLPGLVLLAAAALVALARGPRLAVALGALAAVNALVFLAVPSQPLGPGVPRLRTLDTVRAHDAAYQARFRAVRERFAPATTLLLADRVRYVEYYLPEYRRAAFPTWLPRGRRQIPVRERELVVVLFDPALRPFNRSPRRLGAIPLADGDALDYLTLREGEALALGPAGFEIVTAGRE